MNELLCSVLTTLVEFKAFGLAEQYAQMVQSHHRGHTVVTDEDKQAAVPGVVALLQARLETKPGSLLYFDALALDDMLNDSQVIQELDEYFEKQRGYEHLMEIHELPAVRAHKEALASPGRLRVDEENILRFVNATVKGTSEAGPMEKWQKQLMTEELLLLDKTYLRDHPEYNSNRGFVELRNCDNFTDKLEAKMLEILCLDSIEERRSLSTTPVQSKMTSMVACGHCGKQESSMSRCGRCKKVNYCSKACQKMDWKKHKVDCRHSG